VARTNQQLLSLRHWGDTLRDERLGSEVTGRIPGAIREFDALAGVDVSLSAEVDLRIGYLELRRRNWASALTHLEAARVRGTEPFLRAAADYFAGWVLEQLNRNDDAIIAYRRAAVITPTMRNLVTRLAALLYARNERVEAYSILDTAVNARPAVTDLMITMEQGDARFMPEWVASIRQAVK